MSLARLMERDLFRQEERSRALNQIVPYDFFNIDKFFKPWDDDCPFRELGNLLKPFQKMSSAMKNLALNSAGSVISDYEKFQVNVDVQHFAPEEIKVKVINGSVIVEGKHEEKRDEHGYVSRQFLRKYTLPEGCLPDTVQSKLSSDGVLTITAPKVLAMPSTGEKMIPIRITGPVKKQIGFDSRVNYY